MNYTECLFCFLFLYLIPSCEGIWNNNPSSPWMSQCIWSLLDVTVKFLSVLCDNVSPLMRISMLTHDPPSTLYEIEDYRQVLSCCFSDESFHLQCLRCLLPIQRFSIFSTGFPFDSSSTNLSSTRMSRIFGSSISSTRTPQILPLTFMRAGFICGARSKNSPYVVSLFSRWSSSSCCSRSATPSVHRPPLWSDPYAPPWR